ncbi:hypothetical protein M3Y97_01016300 [Aphelenchoides bicaudatus]|nr:hypothetical protein M3Y97_01016300 [Aphelenchoides bicaudatus]
MEIDKGFCFSWPFGVLKTLHVMSPFATLVTIYLGPYKYASIGFVQFVSWTFLFANLIYLVLYLFGVHKRNMAVGQSSIAYIPLALTDFFVSCFGTILFLISALICLICIFSSIEHRLAVTLTYLFAFIFTTISFLASAYYAILIYRAMPNGRWKNLQYLIITGREIILHPASGLTTSTSSNAQPNTYRPPTGYVV